MKIKRPDIACAMCRKPNAVYNESDLCAKCQEGVALVADMIERQSNPELRGFNRVVVDRGDDKYDVVLRR